VFHLSPYPLKTIPGSRRITFHKLKIVVRRVMSVVARIVTTGICHGI
jgi:hypothetical protein